MRELIAGALIVCDAVAGLLFLRFWADSRDRLFLAFSACFFLLGVQRLGLALALITNWPGGTIGFFVLRATAFLLLVWAIVDKNRARRSS